MKATHTDELCTSKIEKYRFFFNLFYFIYMLGYIQKCPQGSEMSIGSLGAEVIGFCEPPDVGALL